MEKCYNITIDEAVDYLNSHFDIKMYGDKPANENAARFFWDSIRIKREIRNNKINYKIIDGKYYFDIDDIDRYMNGKLVEYDAAVRKQEEYYEKCNKKAFKELLIYMLVFMTMLITYAVYLYFTDQIILRPF